MPIGRILLKSISQSKKLSRLQTHGARLLYSWLIPNLDKNGCFSGESNVIKGLIFTRLQDTDEEIESYLEDLEDRELIVRYEVNGDVFLNVPDFEERQPNLNKDREGKTNIPLPTPELIKSKSRLNPSKDKISKDKIIKDNEKEETIIQKDNVNEIDVYLTQLLITLMQKNDPKSSIIRDLTENRQRNWINDCRLLRERDKRSPEDIKRVIEFSQADDFWKSNILSMSKLRNQFGQLWIKSKPKQSLSEKIDAWANKEEK